MRTKPPLLVGLAAVGVALLALAGPSDEPRGGVVLNPAPPPPLGGGLGGLLEFRLVDATAGAPNGAPPPEHPAGSGQGALLDDIDPGVWATPAMFSESD